MDRFSPRFLFPFYYTAAPTKKKSPRVMVLANVVNSTLKHKIGEHVRWGKNVTHERSRQL